MEVVLLLSAERDLQEAYNWVEEHRRGREQFFLRDVGLRLEHLKKFPLIGRLYRGRYRRLLIPRYLPRCRVKQDCCSCLPRSPARSRKDTRALFPNRGYLPRSGLMRQFSSSIKS